MRIRYRAVLLAVALSVTGCTSEEFTRFWENPFSDSAHFDPSKAPNADPKTATRVHSIGNAVLAANKADIDIQATFFTVGLAEPMAFHQADGSIVVSEGIVKRCSSDAELAAILSHQLAEMVASKQDRDSLRSQDRDLPPNPRLTPDVAGNSFGPDMTRAAEEGYAQRNRPAKTARAPRTESAVLARAYLQKAGYDAADYTRVEGLLRDAEKNAADRSFMRQR